MKIVTYCPAREPGEWARYIFDDGTVLDTHPTSSPKLTGGVGVGLDDDAVAAYLHAASEYGVITEDDYSWETGDDGVAWIANVDEEALADRGLEWSDLVQAVAERAKYDLEEEYYAAWCLACERGEGPDAIAAVDGRRWVAGELDVELARVAVGLERLQHLPEVQAAVDVIVKHYLPE